MHFHLNMKLNKVIAGLLGIAIFNQWQKAYEIYRVVVTIKKKVGGCLRKDQLKTAHDNYLQEGPEETIISHISITMIQWDWRFFISFSYRIEKQNTGHTI